MHILAVVTQSGSTGHAPFWIEAVTQRRQGKASIGRKHDPGNYRKFGCDGDLAPNNHYGELTRCSSSIQLGTSTFLRGDGSRRECNEAYAFTCWTGRT